MSIFDDDCVPFVICHRCRYGYRYWLLLSFLRRQCQFSWFLPDRNMMEKGICVCLYYTKTFPAWKRECASQSDFTIGENKSNKKSRGRFLVEANKDNNWEREADEKNENHVERARNLGDRQGNVPDFYVWLPGLKAPPHPQHWREYIMHALFPFQSDWIKGLALAGPDTKEFLESTTCFVASSTKVLTCLPAFNSQPPTRICRLKRLGVL